MSCRLQVRAKQAIEHIMYRRAANSGFENVSRLLRARQLDRSRVMWTLLCAMGRYSPTGPTLTALNTTLDEQLVPMPPERCVQN